MKNFIVIVFFVSSLLTNSQTLILTKAANEPVIGDTSKYYPLDTTAYVSGLNAAATGSNFVWNYSGLTSIAGSLVSAYLSPTTVANPPSGCTILQKQGTLNSFYKSVSSPSTQLEFMGINSTSLSLNFTNTAVAARFPFTYGDSFTDSFSGSFTFSLSGTASGNATVSADGNGTLNLPGGITLTNVLRVKSQQLNNLSALGGLFSGTLRQTSYSYYHSTQKYPVLMINYQSVAIAGQSPSVTVVVQGNSSYFVAGIHESELTDSKAKIFPNPFTNSISVEIDPLLIPKETRIYDQLGQLIYKNEFSKEVDLHRLNSGIYIVEVDTEKGLVHKRLVKE